MMKILVTLFFALSGQLSVAWCHCQYETRLSATVSGSLYHAGDVCWSIRVPEGAFIHIKIQNMSFDGDCFIHAKVQNMKTLNEHKFCNSYDIENSVTAFNNVTVTFGKRFTTWTDSVIAFEYKIREIACANPNSFKCDNYSCVPRDQVCNGVKNCENGADEVGCETGILAIDGVTEARKSALNWLLAQRSASWGWKEDTPRAVAALYLAGGANYNGTDIEEELMVKEAELKIATSLLRPSLTNSELSMFVHALLVTCHNPRHFYGNDLVKRVKDQVEQTSNFTHPLSYLALCNANETWPEKAVEDLVNVLDSNWTYPFIQDFQAIAHMAFSCAANKTTNFTHSFGLTAFERYSDFTRHFKEVISRDGSYGNAYTTALVTQALVASGQEHDKGWHLNKTVKHLIRELNSSSVDFLLTYFTLPILNRRTLAGIWKRDCSGNPRKEDPISEITDYLGEKMRVRYSLYIGDEKDIIHTISLRVPENYSAFEVMELAEAEDPKYGFEWKKTFGKNYIYEIANITNDPEHGKFWLLFISSSNGTRLWEQPIEGPDKVILQENDHLVLWYKTASI